MHSLMQFVTMQQAIRWSDTCLQSASLDSAISTHNSQLQGFTNMHWTHIGNTDSSSRDATK